MSKLHSDDYDPTEACDRLTWLARDYVGRSAWRAVGPEVEDFIRHEVAGALLNAFSEAEAVYLRDICRRSDEFTATLFKGVMAGAELRRRQDAGEDL